MRPFLWRCLRPSGALREFFSISASYSLQKSSIIQKISVTLSLDIIGNIFVSFVCFVTTKIAKISLISKFSMIYVIVACNRKLLQKEQRKGIRLSRTHVNRTTLIMKTIEELFFIFVNVFLFKQYLPTKRVHLLYFRERFAHLTEGHLNLIACVLRLTCCAY